MENNSLMYFKYPYEFSKFLMENRLYNSWMIEEGKMNNRGNAIRDKKYYEKLSGLFREKELFRKNVSVAEVVTWLDSFVHVNRILNYLKTKVSPNVFKEIEIAFEVVIRMSKNSRVDFIVKYKNTYCLFEFKTISSFENLKPSYDHKRLELILYKDMLSNYIYPPSKIIVYPFIGLYEYKFKQNVEKHYQYNLSQAEYAADYIIEFMINGF